MTTQTENKENALTTDQQNKLKRDIQHAEDALNLQIEYAKLVVKLIAKHIRPKQVRMFGDNLHFERSACEQILSWGGVSITDVEIKEKRYEDDKGVFYDFETWGTVQFKDGREMRLMGNCSTRSDFFGKKKDEYLPLSEVDIPSIKQASYTNLMNHAAIRFFGLKSITLDELKAAGMDIEKIEKVSFERGGQGGKTITPEETEKQTQLANIVLQLVDGDKTKVAAKLKELTGFKSGNEMVSREDVRQLSGNWLVTTLKKANEALDKKNAGR